MYANNILNLSIPSIKLSINLLSIIFENIPPTVVGISIKIPTESTKDNTKDIQIIASFALSLKIFFINLSKASSSISSVKNSDEKFKQHHSQRETPFVPSKRLPDWASLELSPSVESCGCGLGPSPVRLG